MLSPSARSRVLLPEPKTIAVARQTPAMRLTVQERRAAEWALWSARQTLKQLDEQIAALAEARGRAANKVMELAIRVRLAELTEEEPTK